MSADRPELFVELKRAFIPAMRKRGFRGSAPHFRRIRGDAIELLAIRFNRDGGGFFLEVARCEIDRLVDASGSPQWPGNVTAWAVAMARLGPHARIRNPRCHLESSDFPGWAQRPDGIAVRDLDVARGAREAEDALSDIEEWYRQAADHPVGQQQTPGESNSGPLRP